MSTWKKTTEEVPPENVIVYTYQADTVYNYRKYKTNLMFRDGDGWHPRGYAGVTMMPPSHWRYEPEPPEAEGDE